MHLIFMPYGMKDWVDKFIRNIQSQYHEITFRKEGEADRKIYVEGSLRILPFGIYEYVFPKEDYDIVATTLFEPSFNLSDDVYEGIGKFKIAALRYMLNAEKMPEFKRDKKYIWGKNNVAIMPIGVRYDGEITEAEGSPSAGYTHERL